MTLMEAHSLALKVLKQVMEEKLDENNVQLAQVCQVQDIPVSIQSVEIYRIATLSPLPVRDMRDGFGAFRALQIL